MCSVLWSSCCCDVGSRRAACCCWLLPARIAIYPLLLWTLFACLLQLVGFSVGALEKSGAINLSKEAQDALLDAPVVAYAIVIIFTLVELGSVILAWNGMQRRQPRRLMPYIVVEQLRLLICSVGFVVATVQLAQNSDSSTSGHFGAMASYAILWLVTYMCMMTAIRARHWMIEKLRTANRQSPGGITVNVINCQPAQQPPPQPIIQTVYINSSSPVSAIPSYPTDVGVQPHYPSTPAAHQAQMPTTHYQHPPAASAPPPTPTSPLPATIDSYSNSATIATAPPASPTAPFMPVEYGQRVQSTTGESGKTPEPELVIIEPPPAYETATSVTADAVSGTSMGGGNQQQQHHMPPAFLPPALALTPSLDPEYGSGKGGAK